jgi:hypothetical protein
LAGRTTGLLSLFALMGSFALASVEIGIRSIIFAIPVAFVAQWCGVPPSWKSFAFVMFCCFWNDCVFGGKGDSASQGDPSAAGNRKAAAIAMTPAQVAAEARKLGLGSQPMRDR